MPDARRRNGERGEPVRARARGMVGARACPAARLSGLAGAAEAVEPWRSPPQAPLWRESRLRVPSLRVGARLPAVRRTLERVDAAFPPHDIQQLVHRFRNGGTGD